jgi:hypothetical protein
MYHFAAFVLVVELVDILDGSAVVDAALVEGFWKKISTGRFWPAGTNINFIVDGLEPTG